MKSFKKVVRWILLSILILLAVSGIGIVGTFLPKNRERYMDNEVRIELVEREDEDEQESEINRN